jgi:ATP-dependent DNA helicase Q5
VSSASRPSSPISLVPSVPCSASHITENLSPQPQLPSRRSGVLSLVTSSFSSQLKPKRVGAGFSKGPCSFQTATELLGKSHSQKQAPEAMLEGGQEPPGWVCDLQDEDRSKPHPGYQEKALGSSVNCGDPSPEKKTKGSSQGSAKARASKKQQLLATAARKDSQNITRFLCQRTESPPLPASVPRSEDASPSCGDVPGKCTQEVGAQGHLVAVFQTEGPRERPR